MSTPPDQLPPIPATPDLFIPQVPFKQLPFPWDDLTNTPQPDATQYYPDHAPSVVATLAGMHPTNQQGQTINTDGNHALLVKDINAASGGSTPNGWIGDYFYTETGHIEYAPAINIHTVFQIVGTMFLYGFSGSGEPVVDLLMINRDHTVGFTMFRATFPKASALGTYVPPVMPFAYTFPGGLDVTSRLDQSQFNGAFLFVSGCSAAVSWAALVGGTGV